MFFNKDLSQDVAIGVTYSVDYICKIYGVKNSLDLINSRDDSPSLIDIAHVPMFHRRVPMNLVRANNETGWKYHERDTSEESWQMVDLTEEKFREFVIPLDSYTRLMTKTPPTGAFAAVTGLFGSLGVAESMDVLFGRSSYGEAHGNAIERREEEARKALERASYEETLKELHRQTSEVEGVVEAAADANMIERLLRFGKYGEAYRIAFESIYAAHFGQPSIANEWTYGRTAGIFEFKLGKKES